MDFHLHGGSPSSSSSDHPRHPNNNSSSLQTPNGHSSDPMHSWWESISKARSRIHLLSSLLPHDDEDPLSSLADTDRPARSLLLSSAAYYSVSAALSSPSSGSSGDPLCHWLYDTYLSSDPDLRLVVLSYLPLITSIYLHRIHHPISDTPVSLSGFEAVLLALYTSETKARNGKSVTVTIPDLSQPSLYHIPRYPKSSNTNSKSSKPLVGVLSPPLEPQVAVKSTKRACIVGVALDCYFKQISQMPSWSKLDFCKVATIWAGKNCPCTSDFDQKPVNFVEKNDQYGDDDGFGDGIRVESDNEIQIMVDRVNDLDIDDGNSEKMEDKDSRIPLPWELLQPIMRILGHCLLGPLNIVEVKDAASMAVRRLYARASHDLVPQAILATRSLIQLDKGARKAAQVAAAAAADTSGSNVNTPSKAKKPEIFLVSK